MLGILGKIENSYENRSYGLLKKTLQELLDMTYEDLTDTPTNIFYLKALGYLLSVLEKTLKEEENPPQELMNLLEKAIDHIAELVFDLNVYYSEDVGKMILKIESGDYSDFEELTDEEIQSLIK